MCVCVFTCSNVLPKTILLKCSCVECVLSVVFGYIFVCRFGLLVMMDVDIEYLHL